MTPTEQQSRVQPPTATLQPTAFHRSVAIDTPPATARSLRRLTGDWRRRMGDNRVALDTSPQKTAATAEAVDAGEPGGEWRLAWARRLDAVA